MVQSYAFILVPIPISPYMTDKEVDVQIEPIYEFSIPIASGCTPERFLICNDAVFILWFQAMKFF